MKTGATIPQVGIRYVGIKYDILVVKRCLERVLTQNKGIRIGLAQLTTNLEPECHF